MLKINMAVVVKKSLLHQKQVFNFPEESLRQIYTYPCYSLQDILLLKGPVIFETFDQSDDRDRDMDMDGDRDRDMDRDGAGR